MNKAAAESKAAYAEARRKGIIGMPTPDKP